MAHFSVNVGDHNIGKQGKYLAWIFIAVGIVIVIGSLVYFVMNKSFRFEGIPIFLFGIFFGSVGVAVLKKRNSFLRSLKQYKLSYPNQPWKWKKTWESGIIPENSKGAKVILVFGFVWLIFTMGFFVIGNSKSSLKNDNYIVLGLFALIGVSMVAYGVYAHLRAKKFKKSTFQVINDFGEISEALLGKVVILKMPPHKATHASCRLDCLRKVVTTNSKGQSSTKLESMFHYDANFELEFPFLNPGQVEIPVNFKLPPDIKESSLHNNVGQIVWRLKATIAVVGIDYAADFDVPIFHKDSPQVTYSGD